MSTKNIIISLASLRENISSLNILHSGAKIGFKGRDKC